jgi:hypothetical protein
MAPSHGRRAVIDGENAGTVRSAGILARPPASPVAKRSVFSSGGVVEWRLGATLAVGVAVASIVDAIARARRATVPGAVWDRSSLISFRYLDTA